MSGRYRSPEESRQPYIDPTPLPASIPHVAEVGTTSAPLKSAAFFIGAYCKDFNDDFMLCKAGSRKPESCLAEGRKVTRCTADIIEKLRQNCADTFEKHWQCLEMNNQDYHRCRKPERAFNTCVFQKLGLTKTIPGSPEGQVPIHEKKNPVFTHVQK